MLQLSRGSGGKNPTAETLHRGKGSERSVTGGSSSKDWLQSLRFGFCRQPCLLVIFFRSPFPIFEAVLIEVPSLSATSTQLLAKFFLFPDS